MRTRPIDITDWKGVFPVPPLARRTDTLRSLDPIENERIVSHIRRGGIHNLLYGGNAFLYHLTLAEYEQLLDWAASLPEPSGSAAGWAGLHGSDRDQARRDPGTRAPGDTRQIGRAHV